MQKNCFNSVLTLFSHKLALTGVLTFDQYCTVDPGAHNALMRT
jgi:hypothetical protein